MKRGRQFEPGNKFGRGRPRGSRNKKTQAQALLNGRVLPILQNAITLAEGGDKQMIRFLLAYMLGSPAERPVYTGPLPMETTEELAESFTIVINKASTGQLSPTEAQRLVALIEARRRVIATEELEAGIRALEQALMQRTEAPGPAQNDRKIHLVAPKAG